MSQYFQNRSATRSPWAPLLIASAVTAVATLGMFAAPAGAAGPSRAVPAHATCPKPYTVVSGDYWIRIAKRSGVTLKQLLAANGATAKTKLFAGHTVCLPEAATAPVSTSASTSAQNTAAQPAAAQPAPTTTAVPARTYTAAEVEAIIREVWPDDLEDEALRIARRESGLKPTAKNSCCYGLFQLYFTVHQKWLSGVGVTSSGQLLDPLVNANAALTLYNRAGGWGPWT